MALDTVVFTGPDKALHDRAARMMEEQAAALHWESVLDSKKRKAAKLVFDRLMRDARDLRALSVRLVKVAKMLKMPAPQALGRLPSEERGPANAICETCDQRGFCSMGDRCPEKVAATAAGVEQVSWDGVERRSHDVGYQPLGDVVNGISDRRKA